MNVTIIDVPPAPTVPVPVYSVDGQKSAALPVSRSSATLPPVWVTETPLPAIPPGSMNPVTWYVGPLPLMVSCTGQAVTPGKPTQFAPVVAVPA